MMRLLINSKWSMFIDFLIFIVLMLPHTKMEITDDEKMKKMWAGICKDLSLTNTGKASGKFGKYINGFAAKDSQSGCVIESYPGRRVYYSFIDFEEPIPAPDIFNRFSEVCNPESISNLNSIANKQSITKFGFESYTNNYGYIMNLTNEWHEEEQLKIHLKTIVDVAREYFQNTNKIK